VHYLHASLNTDWDHAEKLQQAPYPIATPYYIYHNIRRIYAYLHTTLNTDWDSTENLRFVNRIPFQSHFKTIFRSPESSHTKMPDCILFLLRKCHKHFIAFAEQSSALEP